ncbi:SPOR domain-containing protein [Bacteroidota bacterium]
MKLLLTFLIPSLLIFISACSSSEKNVKKQNEDKVYIFDEVPIEDVSGTENVDDLARYNYFVQIGAFATRNNAELFAKESSGSLVEELEILFNNNYSLYQVRIKKEFPTRAGAIELRDKIRRIEKFKDAWVVKVPK